MNITKFIFFSMLMSCSFVYAAEFCKPNEIAIRIFSSYTCAKNIKLIEYIDGSMRFTTVANDANLIEKSTYVSGSYKKSKNNKEYVEMLKKNKLVLKQGLSKCGLDIYDVKSHPLSEKDVISRMYVTEHQRLELVTFNEENQELFMKKYCENWNQIER